MSLRPQTLYGLADSPVGLAGWILDHDIRSYRMIVRVFDGKPEGLSRDDVLDNITLYWLTNTAVSSARLYWDTAHICRRRLLRRARRQASCRGERPSRKRSIRRESWSEKAYVKLAYYGSHPKGTHFAAWEQPRSSVRCACHVQDIARVGVLRVRARSCARTSLSTEHPCPMKSTMTAGGC